MVVDNFKVKSWMKHHAHDYLDDHDILNMTALAEATAAHFDMYDVEDTIPEDIFELSYEVGKELGILEDL